MMSTVFQQTRRRARQGQPATNSLGEVQQSLDMTTLIAAGGRNRLFGYDRFRACGEDGAKKLDGEDLDGASSSDDDTASGGHASSGALTGCKHERRCEQRHGKRA